jgi:hypothetical protein
MSKFKTTMLRIVGRLKKMVSLFTALGTMFVPLGVLLVIERPDWSWLALCLILIGIISLIIGWVYVIREERQRRREGKVFSYMLTGVAEKLGVDLKNAVKGLEKLIDGK